MVTSSVRPFLFNPTRDDLSFLFLTFSLLQWHLVPDLYVCEPVLFSVSPESTHCSVNEPNTPELRFSILSRV